MNRAGRYALTAAATLSLAGCSGGYASPSPSPVPIRGGGSVSIVPPTRVTLPPDGSGGSGGGGPYTPPVVPVQPTTDPQVDNVHVVAWTSATPTSDGRTITVRYPGVHGCGGDLLAGVAVDESDTQVVITVSVGAHRYTPGEPQPLCPAQQVVFTTNVMLSSPLGTRKVIDGSS